jgi:hypothetical protein
MIRNFFCIAAIISVTAAMIVEQWKRGGPMTNGHRACGLDEVVSGFKEVAAVRRGKVVSPIV